MNRLSRHVSFPARGEENQRHRATLGKKQPPKKKRRERNIGERFVEATPTSATLMSAVTEANLWRLDLKTLFFGNCRTHTLPAWLRYQRDSFVLTGLIIVSRACVLCVSAVCVLMWLCICVSVCVCVCERQSDREGCKCIYSFLQCHAAPATNFLILLPGKTDVTGQTHSETSRGKPVERSSSVSKPERVRRSWK